MGSEDNSPTITDNLRHCCCLVISGLVLSCLLQCAQAETGTIEITSTNHTVQVGDPFNVTCDIRVDNLEGVLRIAQLFHARPHVNTSGQSVVLDNKALALKYTKDPYDRYDSYGILHGDKKGANITFIVEAAFLEDGGLYTCHVMLKTVTEQALNTTATVNVTGTEDDEEKYKRENKPMTTTQSTTTLIVTTADLTETDRDGVFIQHHVAEDNADAVSDNYGVFIQHHVAEDNADAVSDNSAHYSSTGSALHVSRWQHWWAVLSIILLLLPPVSCV